MARRPQDEYVTREHFDATINRMFVFMERRFSAQDARFDARFDAMNAKLDRHMEGVDRTMVELIGARESLAIYGKALRDHRLTLDSHDRRLTSLESRLPPPAP